MNQQIKNLIKRIPGVTSLHRLALSAKKEYKYFAFTEKVKKYAKRNPKGCFLVFTPIHGNLGDHAIAKAETDILTEQHINFFEIPGNDLNNLDKHGHLPLLNGHPILINGGGILGTLWPDDESLVRKTILSNPQSKILIFPNTVYYENTEKGKKEFERAKNIYGSHTNLKLYTREAYSYEVSKQLCQNTALVPDMVLSMKCDENSEEREGCLLCLRSDRERTLSAEERNEIYSQAKDLFHHVELIDTVKAGLIPIAEREDKLNSFFSALKKTELVITDRLHGMIFCAITGTPCIVVNSKSPKVLGCYDWLKDLPYIKFCTDCKEIKEIYLHMPHGSQHYDNSSLIVLYESLRNDLRCI